MLKLEIKTGGAAFCDPYTGEEDKWCEEQEVARLLRKVAANLDSGNRYGSIMDLNGNKVGEWKLN